MVRGDGHHEIAAALELGRDGRERRAIVVDMLDHVERADEVVVARPEPPRAPAAARS